ncbi:MAG: EF2563 family selenium-dependent molybdenum hydroxylase system protein [Candidatus Zixiibacteriota bacterium]|nr:MAG: EF2563 family selenium-dependent molybdenum hydroxylase system protein [candidate division Zixibacteria bacterium]
MSQHFVPNRVVVRGAGEMASGVIRRLVAAGFDVIALEQPAPTCIRRYVCYAEAFYEGEVSVEGITCVLVNSVDDAVTEVHNRRVPLLVDPKAEQVSLLAPEVVIDGRMLKRESETDINLAPLVIGLGPGFVAGENCHAVIETNRGPDLGRVIYNGSARAYTGTPAPISGFSAERLVLSPADGLFASFCLIGDTAKPGQVLGAVSDVPVVSRIEGTVRGIVRDGLEVSAGQKIGDVDPRGIREYCHKMSDKANAVGEGTLQAIISLKAGIAHR